MPFHPRVKCGIISRDSDGWRPSDCRLHHTHSGALLGMGANFRTPGDVQNSLELVRLPRRAPRSADPPRYARAVRLTMTSLDCFLVRSQAVGCAPSRM